MRERTRARTASTVCLERRAESSCTELRLKGPKCKAVLGRGPTLTRKQKKDPTYVEGVLSPTLPVHAVHQVAGAGLEEEAEDGHADTETPGITEGVVGRVEDGDVDDVCEDCEQQPSQELETRTEKGT